MVRAYVSDVGPIGFLKPVGSLYESFIHAI